VHRRALLLVALSACARAGQELPNERVDASTGDGGDDPDAPVRGDAIDMPTGTHLLLSEVVLQPSAGEFIEIVNPTNAEVDLSVYYLSDNGNYFRIPAGPITDASFTSDFVARFPAGATIASTAVITVALDTAANFTTTYGMAPTYSIADATMTVVQKSGTPSLTNTGELVALFEWDGSGDLVKDVDLLLAGMPTAANGLVAKSAVAQDGPDANSTTTAYVTDAATLANQTGAPGSGMSTKRIASETGHETQVGGGNGLTGDDETSENTAVTWDSTFTAPTPGAVPPAIFH
jgi:hypothetical protein